jgi:epoxyqueuosine reductase
VCPFNVKFAQELKEPAFAPRAVLAGKDARTLARDILAMSQEELSVAFKNSPMKRAKLRGLKRNAAVVLGNVGTGEDANVLARALDDEEPLVHEHVAWAFGRLGPASATDVLRRRLMAESDASVIRALDSALAELES